MLKTKIINYHTNEVTEATLQPRSAQQAECLIGRHPNCDLVLDGPAVSRVHGRLLFDSGDCFFSDLGSTDGSRLNNEDVVVNEGYAIAPDDVLRIGEFALIVEAFSPVPVSTHQSQTWSGEEITARCVQVIQETPDVKTFRFVAEPECRFDFKPGQFVSLKLPITHPQTGQPVTRAYSISSSPSRPHTLDITVKRVGAAGPDLPPGLVSNWLHDTLEPGMTLSMQGPYGDFNCIDHSADKLLLISAGSGITPMMSMAQWASDRAANIDITFIHLARTAQDLIFRQRLALLAAQHPNFNLAFSLTQSTPSVPWAGYRGRLNPHLLTAICPDFATRTVFVCGPAGFMDATRSLLSQVGFPMENYFEESFGGAPKTIERDDSLEKVIAATETPMDLEAEATVAFTASGKEVSCTDGETLLEAAEEVGVTLPSGCRMGSCGACKHAIAAGQVSYDIDPKGLSESDRQQGQVLTCIAKPVGKVVLEV